MNEYREEFEFTHKVVSDEINAHTNLSFSGDGMQTYSEVVEKFLGFLSSVYGYSITLDQLAIDAGYRKQEWPEFGSS